MHGCVERRQLNGPLVSLAVEPHKKVGACDFGTKSIMICSAGFAQHNRQRSNKSMITEEELQRQNERLELLLNLTTRITSSLDLREVLRAIAANIREVIHADAIAVSLPEAASGKNRVFAMDFPHGKGMVREDLLVTPGSNVKRAMDTLKPVVIDAREDN